MTRPDLEVPAPSANRRILTLVVFCAGTFLAATDTTLVNVAFPNMLKSFPHSSLAGLSWVFNGYTITFTAALLPAGALADRFGYRRVYLTGLATFVVSAALCAVAPSAAFLVGARLLQGAGGGVITPLTLALILPQFPRERRATAIGLWSATQSVAIAAAPSIGGALVAAWDWRTVFMLHLPIGISVLVGASRVLPRAKKDDLSRQLPDLVGLALLVAAIGLLSLAIVESSAWGVVSVPTIAVSVAGIASGVLFARRTTRRPAPIVDPRILRAAGIVRANAAMFVLGLVMFALQLANVLFLTGVWGYSEAMAGLALTPGPVAQVLVAAVSGRLNARVGYRVTAFAGIVLLVFGTLMLTLGTGEDRAYLSVVLPAIIAAGAGIALLVTSLSGMAVAAVPADLMATGTALSVTTRASGAIIGVSSLALALSSVPRGSIGTYHHVWATMAVLAGILAIAAAGIRTASPAERP
jgi:EmrB/QacA subfamily drug resistance transporter